MSEKLSKSRVLFSMLWKFMERSITQGIQFIVQIVLARLLLPEDYGVLALVTIFIILANVFIQSGFNTALIQRKNIDEIDLSSVFYITLFISGLLYLIIFLTAPFVADFYNNEQLTVILRVLSIILFFGAVNSVQYAIISRNMLFKRLFFSSLGAVVVSGTIGIIMAYEQYGVWALVVQQIVNQFMITIILWFTVKWRPSILFSINRVKILFSFGWKLLAAELINNLYYEIRGLLIGKLYTPAMLGFYNRGQQFPLFFVNNINGTIQTIMLPVLSSEQDDVKKIKNMMRRFIVTSSYVMFPMMTGMAVVAEPLVKVLLTEKWIPAVPFLQIFCAFYVLWPIHTANLQAINALGRSDIFLKLEIYKKIVGTIILLISLPFGIYALAWGVVVSGIFSSIINASPNSKMLDYSYREQCKDIFPALVLSTVMGILIYFIKYIGLSDQITLFTQVLTGFLIYIGLSKFLKIESYNYLVETIKGITKNK